MIYTNKSQPLQYINKIPYLIFAKIRIEDVKDVPASKEYFGVDTAFQNIKEGVFYFANEIKEAEYEEI